VAGVLLLIACSSLFGRYVPMDWRETGPLLLGLAFIAWAALVRSPGLLVPGGMLTGIGVGVLLREEYGNAAFLFSLSGGFLLVGLLSGLIFGRGARWTVFPAAGLAFAGLTQVAGPEVRFWLREFRPVWPFILILVAGYLLLVKPRAR
jgi:hypothetical protein